MQIDDQDLKIYIKHSNLTNLTHSKRQKRSGEKPTKPTQPFIGHTTKNYSLKKFLNMATSQSLKQLRILAASQER